MGGSPLLALSIAAFPESLPERDVAAIFGAADEQVRAAGAILAGGHTLRDEEPKYGLAVVGTVIRTVLAEERRAAGRCALPDEAARDGDAPARRARGASPRGRACRGDDAMTTLSRDAADALRPFEPNAVTDVTGFGLLGHAQEMAERSGVRIELDAASCRSSRARSRRRRPESGRAATRGTATSPART